MKELLNMNDLLKGRDIKVNSILKIWKEMVLVIIAMDQEHKGNMLGVKQEKATLGLTDKNLVVIG